MEFCELALICTSICACEKNHFYLFTEWASVSGDLIFEHLVFQLFPDWTVRMPTQEQLCTYRGIFYNAGHDICCWHLMLYHTLFIVHSHDMHLMASTSRFKQ